MACSLILCEFSPGNIAPEGSLCPLPPNGGPLLLATPQVARCGGANAVVLLLLLPPKVLHVVGVTNLHLFENVGALI